MSKEEITCILSLLGDLRGVRHMVRADDRFTAIFAICIAVGRSIRAPVGLPCQRPLFRSHPRTHTVLFHAVSSVPVGPSVGLFPCVFGQIAFRQGSWQEHGRARLSLQFSVFSASTQDPGMRALARRNGFLHVRCSFAPSTFSPFFPRSRVCLFVSANACMAWAATRPPSAPGVYEFEHRRWEGETRVPFRDWVGSRAFSDFSCTTLLNLFCYYLSEYLI